MAIPVAVAATWIGARDAPRGPLVDLALELQSHELACSECSTRPDA